MNAAAESTTRPSTSPMPTSPRGRCREAVRGFSASLARSTSRLKAIAAVRAATMQAMMPSTGFTSDHGSVDDQRPSPPNRIAIRVAITAKGNAKIVWLNRTSSR